MVSDDRTASPAPSEQTEENATPTGKECHRIRVRSHQLVKEGYVDLTPCVACGTHQNLTIHHVEPMKPDRFVFLCEECHDLAHTPVFVTMEVCVASGHFSIRPEAIVQVRGRAAG